MKDFTRMQTRNGLLAWKVRNATGLLFFVFFGLYPLFMLGQYLTEYSVLRCDARSSASSARCTFKLHSWNSRKNVTRSFPRADMTDLLLVSRQDEDRNWYGRVVLKTKREKQPTMRSFVSLTSALSKDFQKAQQKFRSDRAFEHTFRAYKDPFHIGIEGVLGLLSLLFLGLFFVTHHLKLNQARGVVQHKSTLLGILTLSSFQVHFDEIVGVKFSLQRNEHENSMEYGLSLLLDQEEERALPHFSVSEKKKARLFKIATEVAETLDVPLTEVHHIEAEETVE